MQCDNSDKTLANNATSERIQGHIIASTKLQHVKQQYRYVTILYTSARRITESKLEHKMGPEDPQYIPSMYRTKTTDPNGTSIWPPL